MVRLADLVPGRLAQAAHRALPASVWDGARDLVTGETTAQRRVRQQRASALHRRTRGRYTVPTLAVDMLHEVVTARVTERFVSGEPARRQRGTRAGRAHRRRRPGGRGRRPDQPPTRRRRRRPRRGRRARRPAARRSRPAGAREPGRRQVGRPPGADRAAGHPRTAPGVAGARAVVQPLRLAARRLGVRVRPRLWTELDQPQPALVTGEEPRARHPRRAPAQPLDRRPRPAQRAALHRGRRRAAPRAAGRRRGARARRHLPRRRRLHLGRRRRPRLARTQAGGAGGGRPAGARVRGQLLTLHQPTTSLRYSLRSLEAYADWIRTVYLVTDDQVPDWLDTTNPRVRVVSHREPVRRPRPAADLQLARDRVPPAPPARARRPLPVPERRRVLRPAGRTRPVLPVERRVQVLPLDVEARAGPGPAHRHARDERRQEQPRPLARRVRRRHDPQVQARPDHPAPRRPGRAWSSATRRCSPTPPHTSSATTPTTRSCPRCTTATGTRPAGPPEAVCGTSTPTSPTPGRAPAWPGCCVGGTTTCSA
nr:hypothetical protein [Angustibacter aerolatus]